MNVSAKPQWQVEDGHVVHLQCQEAQPGLAGSKKNLEKNTIPQKGIHTLLGRWLNSAKQLAGFWLSDMLALFIHQVYSEVR